MKRLAVFFAGLAGLGAFALFGVCVWFSVQAVLHEGDDPGKRSAAVVCFIASFVAFIVMGLFMDESDPAEAEEKDEVAP